MIYMWSLQEFIGILRNVVIGSRYHVYSIKDTIHVPSFGGIFGQHRPYDTGIARVYTKN